MEIYFGTPIWQVGLDVDNTSLRTFLDEYKNSHRSVHHSNRGGWQSETNLHEIDEIKPLAETIRNICSELGVVNSSEVYQMWANYNYSNNYNVPHVHGNETTLSSVYYVSTPQNCGDIVFRDPRAGAVGNGWFNENITRGELVNFKPQAGMLLIFPNFLEHWVEPNTSGSARVSITTDVILK